MQVDLHLQDSNGRTALHYCSDNSSVQPADLLLAADQTLLSAADRDGYTALHLAVMIGNALMVRFLLQRNAPITAVDSEGHGIVHWAIGQSKIIL